MALHKLVAMNGSRILLVIGGGIAAYKACELVRLIRKHGGDVTCVLTKGGAQFVTPMTLAALSENPVHSSLWDLKNEVEMGHIQLSRQADLIVVCPATADLMAKMAHGIADDLATTLLLATDKPVMAVPAMNVRMWEHAATQANVATLRQRGVTVLNPDEGPMACGEFGPGRLPEPTAVMQAIGAALAANPLAGQPDFEADPAHRPLFGKHVLVTAGPTHEPIDPVRYIANRSSGKQGFAIAAAAARAGARVTLVAGPVALPTPPGVDRIDVETAREMAAAVQQALPADCAVMVAAVADWRTEDCAPEKMKKRGAAPPALRLTENPDILATVASLPAAPFCVGFAAESQNLLQYADEKRRRKNIPLLVANLVQAALGADDNEVILLDDAGDYADPAARLANSRTCEWQHPVSAVVTALIEAGLHLRSLRERERQSGLPRLPVIALTAGAFRDQQDAALADQAQGLGLHHDRSLGHGDPVGLGQQRFDQALEVAWWRSSKGPPVHAQPSGSAGRWPSCSGSYAG